jgi:hypothetical protein
MRQKCNFNARVIGPLTVIFPENTFFNEIRQKITGFWPDFWREGRE